MVSKLPINLEDLLRQRTVEGDRIEFKAGWNPDATGEVTGEVAEREIEGFTGEVTGEVLRLLEVFNEQMQRRAIQDALGLKYEDHFRRAYLLPALAAGVIEMTIPEKPQSSQQRYRLTRKG